MTTLTELTLEVDEARQNLPALLARVKKEGISIVLHKDGEPLARLSPVSVTETVEAPADADALGVFPPWMDPFVRFSQAFDDVPLDELERQVDLAVAEVRAERRRPAAGASSE